MKPIVNYYSQFDEWGRLDREPWEYTINLSFIKKYLPAGSAVLDNGAGPGKYAMELAREGHDVTLADLTSKLVETARSKAAELGLLDRFRGFHAADARDLSLFGDGQFDASLMLGPLYHLQGAEDREKAVRELHRVTAKDGWVFVAFMPRIRHLANSLRDPLNWKPNDTVRGLEAFAETGRFDHSDAGRFTGAYYFPVGDIVPFMETNGFGTVKLIGSGSIAAGMTGEQWDYWRSQGEEVSRRVLDLIMQAAEDPYNLGSSSHLLYVGRRL
ncbi:class I SAM-dependent methyltransferase [Paenibacillus chitinolyticus]|uniref:Class I SAM-dependent methyltransferase n=1 Tax=Paenibacillus chitinolyticus TaxID=79263 RepID=A0A410WZC5_9BACL|nr:class I SAM-dependent methyltransferase [Paenibacillus chitinolyticus]MCY9590201.1 class I SAM-dependent methyltransferase [Paenibacillus chitinolyticus]MCY9596897.1 class I SAM-dependent methyltransferase [Paenibacillus chitinolyticus]QAV19788.1 class I SAM-dependent methyltransferase [Paenibacillus chitinolyticus]